jgi:hypothetical protein
LGIYFLDKQNFQKNISFSLKYEKNERKNLQVQRTWLVSSVPQLKGEYKFLEYLKSWKLLNFLNNFKYFYSGNFSAVIFIEMISEQPA